MNTDYNKLCILKSIVDADVNKDGYYLYNTNFIEMSENTVPYNGNEYYVYVGVS